MERVLGSVPSSITGYVPGVDEVKFRLAVLPGVTGTGVFWRPGTVTFTGEVVALDSFKVVCVPVVVFSGTAGFSWLPLTDTATGAGFGVGVGCC